MTYPLKKKRRKKNISKEYNPRGENHVLSSILFPLHGMDHARRYTIVFNLVLQNQGPQPQPRRLAGKQGCPNQPGQICYHLTLGGGNCNKAFIPRGAMSFVTCLLIQHIPNEDDETIWAAIFSVLVTKVADLRPGDVKGSYRSCSFGNRRQRVQTFRTACTSITMNLEHFFKSIIMEPSEEAGGEPGHLRSLKRLQLKADQ